MVCDGKRPVSPLFCTLDNILHIGHAVHIAHLGMTVQLHALSRAVVHPRRREIRNFHDADDRPNRELSVEGIIDGDTLYFQKCPCL